MTESAMQSERRKDNLAPLTSENLWDLVVVGGGITGAGVAREAARAGLKVLLVERQDFAWGTSSRSSKMVHGGLRYIAQGDVRTTMHSVHERERLMREAPGLVDLMPYVMPHYAGKFPGRWLFGGLLRVYDWLAGQRYRQYHSADAVIQRFPLLRRQRLTGATEFADAVTDDSRLVQRVLQEACDDGATAINYLGVTSIKQDSHGVSLTLQDALTSDHHVIRAQAVVNATGVWVNDLRQQLGKTHSVRPARGSHIVVEAERLPTDVSFTVLHPKDKRPIFVYPWEGRTVIGTTDLDHPAPGNDEVGITYDELHYLLDLVRYQFPQAEISERDVISSWAGVRPLVASGADNSSKESRDHTVWQDGRVVSVSGGKLTTFRRIAHDVLSKLREDNSDDDTPPAFPELTLSNGPVFTASASVSEGWADVLSTLPEKRQRRLLGFYGRCAKDILAQSSEETREVVPGTDVLWAELVWSAANEQVVHLDDLLLRRTRVGLLVPQGGLTHESTLKSLLQSPLGWSDAQWQEEVRRYRILWETFYWLPSERAEVLAGHTAEVQQAS
ncbi:MAG: FAD-dependent oxidoreductase [Pseudomonas sp.]|nr:FAD-dependent oxidoreductase [Pseudomonas sp.]